jgi:molybdopterin molybdotransferase
MISVEEAVARIAGPLKPLNTEQVPIAQANGRVLAQDIAAPFDQPPAAMSAMDGYAVRAADVASVPVDLQVIGEAPAGHPFAGLLNPGKTVRIFTGGVVPQGADTIVIQENTEASHDSVRVKQAARASENIRKQGSDFAKGDILIAQGHRLSARDIALLASADCAFVPVTRRPRIAIAATGDELIRPGNPRTDGGIVASSLYGIAGMVQNWGGEAIDIGILPDRAEAFADLPNAVRDADLVVTLGGASVGDHDLVQHALAPHGFALDFWKISMRPGKPLIFGRLNGKPFLGLPGNPVSAFVCAILFLKPALAAMLGADTRQKFLRAKLASPLNANGKRQDYIRARLLERGGELIAEPFTAQDSAMQKIFARADGLILRAPNAPAAEMGATVEVLPLDDC